MSAIEKRSATSIASIQQNVIDHKSLAKELQGARETIHAHEQEILVLKQVIAKQQNDLATKEAEKNKLQFALDAVVKELTATKVATGDVQGQNLRLKRDLERWSPAAVHSPTNTPSLLQTARLDNTSPLTPTRPTTEQGRTPRTPAHASRRSPTHTASLNNETTRSAAVLDATNMSSGSALGGSNPPLEMYLHRCFDCDVAPHGLVVKSLYKGGVIVAGDALDPVHYGQLAQLVEVLGAKRFISPLEAPLWPTISRLDIVCADDEARGLVATLIDLCGSTLTSLSVSDVDDRTAPAIAGSIAVAVHLTTLELPNLKVTDEGMQLIMKVVANRDIAASAMSAGTDRDSGRLSPAQITLGAAPSPTLVGSPIAVHNLDLSQTRLTEGDTFFLIKGSFIHSINFRDCIGLLDKFLGEVIMSSPNLESLDLTNCASLTQDAVMFINQAKNLKRLSIVNCPALHSLRLNTVVELTTDFRGVTHFNAPQLERFTIPLQAFGCVSFECPKLTELSIANTTLSQREFLIIGDCSSLTVAQFINCRTSSFGQFLKRMRRLSKLSVRCCKGITDADLECIGPTVEDLDLTECYCLTDKLAQRIASICKILKRLTLKRCSGLSDSGLFYLAQCPELTFLNVLGMRKVTVEGLRRVCQQAPSLTHLIHETFMSTVVRVDRADDEESLRQQNRKDEQEVIARRQNLALSYNSRAPIAAVQDSLTIDANRTNGWFSNVRPRSEVGDADSPLRSQDSPQEANGNEDKGASSPHSEAVVTTEDYDVVAPNDNEMEGTHPEGDHQPTDPHQSPQIDESNSTAL